MTQGVTSSGWLRRYGAPLAVGIAALVIAVLALRLANDARASLPSTEMAAARGPCLLPAEQMRRAHMDLLLHERRVAVREGIRNPQASLERCVTCHATHDAAGISLSANDPRHFCRACHDQVAVRVDCFSCHRATPAIAAADTETAR